MKLYYCGTYYHTLIATIKAMNDAEVSDILLANDIPGFGSLKENLLHSGVFQSVLTYDALSFDSYYVFNNRFERVTKARKIVCNRIPETVPLSDDAWKGYSGIYIFNDMTGPAKYLILKGIKYHLLEDALDYFVYFDKYYKIPEGAFAKGGFRQKVKTTMGVGFNLWGQNDCCTDIEVNSKENIKIPQDKVIEVSRKELFSSLSDEQKKIIYAIFAKGKATGEKTDGKSMILLTQPLFKDKFVVSEEKQRIVFESVIKEYRGKSYAVAIKPHPRDEMDYFPLIEKYGCTYIDKNIPSEMLNFDKDSSYDVAVSITSTAINFLENVGEKRFMGREYISICTKE